jgi:glucosamine--fructose-6-phosphate aminotransferase (isomerizing)
MHGPKSLIQDTFKLFTLSMNDSSGLTVQKDSNEISQYTKLVYNISSTNKGSRNFFFPSNQITEFDSIVIMTKFYPWIIKYAQKKGLDPDKPRYLTKVTETF